MNSANKTFCSNPLSLENKRILVTGASSGIGRACAVQLSQLGARLVVTGRNEGRLKETLDGLAGSDHCASVFDLENKETIQNWLSDLCTSDPIAGFVHCAGILLTLPVKSIDEKLVRKVMSVNVESAFFLARAFRRKGNYHPPSSIVFIASIAGFVGKPGLSMYSASKGAVISMSRSMAVEFARDGIRVNTVSPGYIATEMTAEQQERLTREQVEAINAEYPLGSGRPEDVAKAAAYLLSDGARWVTGSNLVVDGGASAH